MIKFDKKPVKPELVLEYSEQVIELDWLCKLSVYEFMCSEYGKTEYLATVGNKEMHEHEETFVL